MPACMTHIDGSRGDQRPVGQGLLAPARTVQNLRIFAADTGISDPCCGQKSRDGNARTERPGRGEYATILRDSCEPICSSATIPELVSSTYSVTCITGKRVKSKPCCPCADGEIVTQAARVTRVHIIYMRIAQIRLFASDRTAQRNIVGPASG